MKSSQHIVDILNCKFDEVLLNFEDTFNVLKKQPTTAKAYENITKIVNTIFQKVFEKVGEIKDQVMLAPKVGPSNARGGEALVADVINNTSAEMNPHMMICKRLV